MNNPVRINLFFPEKLDTAIREYSQSTDRSISEIIRAAVEEYLESKKVKKVDIDQEIAYLYGEHRAGKMTFKEMTDFVKELKGSNDSS